MFLEFPHRWWQEECAGFSLIWSKEDKEEFIKSYGQVWTSIQLYPLILINIISIDS